MIVSILKLLTKYILSQVSSGFARMAESLGILNEKITIVENEVFKRTDKIDLLTSEIEHLNSLTQTEIDAIVDEVSKEVGYK
jgi:archaellum component FlaC